MRARDTNWYAKQELTNDALRGARSMVQAIDPAHCDAEQLDTIDRLRDDLTKIRGDVAKVVEREEVELIMAGRGLDTDCPECSR